MSEDKTVQSASKVSLGQYGKHFQEVVVQALLSDKAWAEQTMEVFNVEYLELKHLQFLAQEYFDHAKKYKVFPSLQLLATIIRDKLKVGTDTVLRDQIVEYLQRIRSNPNVNDVPYVKEKTLDFCRKQALKHAFEVAIDQMQAERYEQIVDGIKKAVTVGTTPSLGHDFFDDFEARFTRLTRNAVPTGIPELDRKEIMNGGCGAGELIVVVGAAGAGKSHFLVMLGANALKQGINVLHYTLELSETQVGIRYDSNLCDIDSNEVIDKKQEVIDKYRDMKGLGRLQIKYFPTSTATIYTLRSHMETLSVKKGFNPGLVIIDYADIMRSTRQYDSLRHELKLIYEELRGFAGEKGIPIVTASQSNKEGASSDVIDLGNMSEAYGKAAVSDIVLSISRKAHEKAEGHGRLYIAKNRAGRDGIVYPVKIDTARSKFEISGRETNPQEVGEEDDKAFKTALKRKWEELKNDPVLQKQKKDEESV